MSVKRWRVSFIVEDENGLGEFEIERAVIDHSADLVINNIEIEEVTDG
jgi:hypothetical protein